MAKDSPAVKMQICQKSYLRYFLCNNIFKSSNTYCGYSSLERLSKEKKTKTEHILCL